MRPLEPSVSGFAMSMSASYRPKVALMPPRRF